MPLVTLVTSKVLLEPQQFVAEAIETDIESNSPTNRPSFLYHLGDVVYFKGKADQYYPQFYEPYLHYQAQIFSIPGNHDTHVGHGDPPSVMAYVENFWAKQSGISPPDAGESPRKAMIQPNVYWALDTPLATLIGLYSDVPPGGKFDDTQISWFTNELRTASKQKALIVCIHHPLYSLDNYHGGSTEIEEVFDTAYNNSGRRADMVHTAHVHDFQHYTEVIDGRQVPHIVAGAGGHHPLHAMRKQSNGGL